MVSSDITDNLKNSRSRAFARWIAGYTVPATNYLIYTARAYSYKTWLCLYTVP